MMPVPLQINSGFGLYFTARTISLLGDTMLQVVLTVAVIQAGYGLSGVGYVLAAWITPVALLVLFGGALADRFNPRRLMVAADLVRMLTEAYFTYAFATGTPAFWQLIVLQVVGGAATAFFTPANATMLLRLEVDTQRATAVLRVAEAMATLIGPSLAGAMLGMFGVAVVFGVDASTFAISALCLGLMRLSALPSDHQSTTGRDASGIRIWHALAEGWQEFRSRTWLWGVILIWSLFGLLVFGPMTPMSATLIVAEDGARGYSLASTAFGAGTVLGGLVGLRLRPARPLVAGALALSALAAAPLVIVTSQPLSVIASGNFIAGAGLAFWSVIWGTTVKSNIPPAVLSRVFAYDNAGSVLVLPISRALTGPVSTAVGTRFLLLTCAVNALLLAAAMLVVPDIRRLRRGEC
jgi:MFS family permease